VSKTEWHDAWTSLHTFQKKYRVELCTVELARGVLRRHDRRDSLVESRLKLWLINLAREVLQRDAQLIKQYGELVQASREVPEGYVRCQAVHHGRLICEEIMKPDDKPTEWVLSLVGRIYFCSAHAQQVEIVNEPTLHASPRC
jgi:hypothetical protein